MSGSSRATRRSTRPPSRAARKIDQTLTNRCWRLPANNATLENLCHTSGEMTMRTLTMAFAITAAAVMAISFASPVPAAPGGSAVRLVLPAPSSPVEPAACRGPGPNCPPGRHWVCGPYGHRCWCAPC
jgi:hypothetical protein